MLLVKKRVVFVWKWKFNKYSESCVRAVSTLERIKYTSALQTFRRTFDRSNHFSGHRYISATSHVRRINQSQRILSVMVAIDEPPVLHLLLADIGWAKTLTIYRSPYWTMGIHWVRWTLLHFFRVQLLEESCRIFPIESRFKTFSKHFFLCRAFQTVFFSVNGRLLERRFINIIIIYLNLKCENCMTNFTDSKRESLLISLRCEFGM